MVNTLLPLQLIKLYGFTINIINSIYGLKTKNKKNLNRYRRGNCMASTMDFEVRGSLNIWSEIMGKLIELKSSTIFIKSDIRRLGCEGISLLWRVLVSFFVILLLIPQKLEARSEVAGRPFLDSWFSQLNSELGRGRPVRSSFFLWKLFKWKKRLWFRLHVSPILLFLMSQPSTYKYWRNVLSYFA